MISKFALILLHDLPQFIEESIQRFAEDAAEAELYDVLAERR